MPTAAVGIAEYPPLLGQASGVVIRRFGARGKVHSHPQNSGAHAGFRKTQPGSLQKIQAWPPLEILREFRGTTPREGVALVRAPSVMRVPDGRIADLVRRRCFNGITRYPPAAFPKLSVA